MSLKQPPSLFFVFVFLCITVWVYFPGLSGTFVFDDFHNIKNNEYLKIDELSADALWQASLSGNSGPLRRPVAVFTFGLNHVMSGMDPYPMKVTNLAIHLFNGLILFFLCRQLFRRFESGSDAVSRYAPLVITAIWLLHPINVSATSYIVQRMTSLSSTFMLLAIYAYLRMRNVPPTLRISWLYIAAVLLCWTIGMFSKEIALSLSIYILAIEWCLYRFKTDAGENRPGLLLLWILLALPWVGAAIGALIDPAFLLRGYEHRNFNVVERLMTEPRVVLDYVRQIILPDIRNMGLYHDDLVVSRGLFSPFTTITSIFAIIALPVSAILLHRKIPFYAMGVLWFIGGLLLESTLYPLELKFYHRNYLPMLGVLFAITPFIAILVRKHASLMLVTMVIIICGYAISTRSLSYLWSEDYRVSVLQADYHPASVRANFRAGQVYKAYAMTHADGIEREKYRQLAADYFDKIQVLDPRDVSGLFGRLETDLLIAREPERELVEEIIEILPTANIKYGVINLTLSVKNCMVSKSCTLAKDDYHRIIKALLNNPGLFGDFRRRVMVMHADYLVKYQDNYDAAITTVLEAMQIHPTLDDLMLLVQYYEEGGYEDYSKSTLDYLEKQDKLGRFRKFVRENREKAL